MWAFRNVTSCPLKGAECEEQRGQKYVQHMLAGTSPCLVADSTLGRLAIGQINCRESAIAKWGKPARLVSRATLRDAPAYLILVSLPS